MTVLGKARGSDFAVFHYSELLDPDALAWDVSSAPWHDFQAELSPPRDVMRSVLSGAELIEVLDAIVAQKERRVFVVAEVQAKQIDANAEYQVCGDLVSLVHLRKRNLPNVDSTRVDLFSEIRRLVGAQADGQPQTNAVGSAGHECASCGDTCLLACASAVLALSGR